MTEQELIQQLRQKNEQAFRWLVENYRNRVFHTVLNILQDSKEAEDAAQETFIQVFESVSGFKEESSLSTWIYRIAVRKALDKIRRKKTRQRLRQLLPWWMPDEKKRSDDMFYHPGIIAENKEKAAVLFKAIESLPEKQKLAFTLIKVQGLNYEEVCSIMQQNIKAVESLITRAKQNLQKLLENYYKTLQ
ncbi:MAG: RNA polymerase sigma factor [Sphingobacteriales bacterium]|nr:RNA polymerase sigma factor [Sphingobacteriales bacterium]